MHIYVYMYIYTHMIAGLDKMEFTGDLKKRAIKN